MNVWYVKLNEHFEIWSEAASPKKPLFFLKVMLFDIKIKSWLFGKGIKHLVSRFKAIANNQNSWAYQRGNRSDSSLSPYAVRSLRFSQYFIVSEQYIKKVCISVASCSEKGKQFFQLWLWSLYYWHFWNILSGCFAFLNINELSRSYWVVSQNIPDFLFRLQR